MPMGISTFDGKVVNDSFAWDIDADSFLHAAMRLERIADEGHKQYFELIKKQFPESHSDTNKGFQKIVYSEEIENAERDSRLDNIVPYLYFHALELSMKSLLLTYVEEIEFKQIINQSSHNLASLLEILKEQMANDFPFDEGEYAEAYRVLNQINEIYNLLTYPYLKNTNHQALKCQGSINGVSYDQVVPSIKNWLSMKSGNEDYDYLEVIKTILGRFNQFKQSLRYA